MSVTKIRDESEARDCIAKLAESGLTLSKWSRSVSRKQASVAGRDRVRREGLGLLGGAPSAVYRKT
jgi:hypothetical protein